MGYSFSLDTGANPQRVKIRLGKKTAEFAMKTAKEENISFSAWGEKIFIGDILTRRINRREELPREARDNLNINYFRPLNNDGLGTILS
jgi:hypothetical protein